MFKKKFKRKNSTFFFEGCTRVSDTLKPDSTSLMVNDTDPDTVELPTEVTSVLSEVSLIQNRNSTSLIKSLTQKIQSTPLKPITDEVRKRNDGTTCVLNSLEVADRYQTTNQSKISYFEQVLKACGATFLSENSSFQLTDDQAVFSLKINNHLAGKDEDIDSFLKSLHDTMEKPKVLQKLLTHTLTANECEEARGPVQDSMMRILLNVPCLQVRLIDALVQKLCDIVLNGNEEECSQMVCLILRQLRYLHVPNNVKIAHKLLEVIHVASINVQREIIFMLPEITPQSEMEDTSLKLMDMLRDEDELTNVIVDAITNFPLKKNVVSKVRTKMFTRLDKCPAEFLPSLIQFIFTKCEEDECSQVINNLRESFLLTNLKHSVMKEGKRDSNENTYLKMAFDILKFSAMASKHVADTWLKVISSASSSSDFRCLDLMMLIIFHGNLQGRKNQIASLLRNKIRCSVLTATHVNDLFKDLTFVVTENFSTVLEIASTLTKSVDSKIANVGAIFYQESFINFNSYMGQSVINELLFHVATGSPHTVDVVLSTLRCICTNHKETLSGHTASIMNLFNKVSDLDSSQMRILMHLVSDLVFFEKLESSQRWQDETLIFIRKQLTSTRLEANKKGIIAALIFAKYGARCETGEYTELIHNLLGLAMDLPGHCEIKRIFFNDEFASMLRDPELNESFSVFWKEKIKQMFPKNLFVRENDVCLTSQHFSAFPQHSICSEEQNQLMFPVVDLVLAANTHKSLDFPITVIPSALKLLWSCEESSSLDIFSAAVVMPEITILSTFQTIDDNQKKMIMDCLHLCINYLIECLNAFSIHNVLDKALLRIRQVLLARTTIDELIPFVPDYSPPCFQFYSSQQKIEANKIEKLPQKGKKRKVNKSSIHDSKCQGVEPLDIEVDRTKGNADKGFCFGYHGRFRDLHISCLNLLKIDLITVNGDMSHLHSPSLSELGIHTEDASYLLEDCLNKCHQLLHNPKGDRNFSAANEMDAQKLISHLLEILPSLITKMEIWSAHSKELIDKKEGIHDGSGMHSKKSRIVHLALANALKLFAEIISWSGFRDPCNKSLLKVVFGIILRRELNFQEKFNLGSGLLAKEAAEAARYFSTFVKSSLLLNGALSVIRTIRACFEFCPSNPANSRILGELCLEVLERPWFTVMGQLEKGTFYNKNIDFLIKTYFCSVQNPLETLRKTVTTILNEIHLLVDGKSSLGTMKSVQRCNFPILYRGMCDALVSGSVRELNELDIDTTNIQIWNRIVEIMLALVNIVKIHSSRVNLAALLKRSQSVIQLFFTNGLPAVEMALRTHPFETLKVLKTLQTVTRFLHSICCHSKVTNDSLVAAHVPTIRAQCERLTLEVKGMLISNKIPMECITIAILKNKDLKGNDILSQESLENDLEENLELLNEESNEFSEDGNTSSH